MAKIKQVFRKLTESFNEFVVYNDKAIDKNQVAYEYTIEQAKLKSYEVRRHTF